MKRAALLVVTLLGVMLALAGCGGGTTGETAEETSVATSTALPASDPLEGYDAMPTEGPNETAALAALPAAVAEAEAAGMPAGVDWSALEGIEPRLVARLVRTDLAGQTTLSEVRADGVPHNIYGYQRAFDSGSLIWMPADTIPTAPVAPQSAGEIRAAAAVEAAMRDAFPEDPFTVAIHGYRFAYVVDGADPVTFEIAPDGSLISASS